jgi:UDP-glucose 4-epimerase
MDGKKMNIIVTGGCGFIGSNLTDALINLGHNVTVIDNLSSDAHDQFYYNKNATYYKDDITNKHIINGIFERHRPDYVFHLAAEARIQNCINDPKKAYDTNTTGTLNILEASRLFGVKRIMFSSTSAIYGLNETYPQTENLNPDCLNMYSYSKLFSEGLFKLYSQMYNVDSVCFRYFNVYGPRQPVRGSYAPVIGVFSRQKKMGDPMTVVGDGLQTRDYIHVSDIVQANIAAMNKHDKLNAEVINIGTNTAFSVLELAIQMGGEYNHVASRQGEARHTLADITKAKTLLGWEPKKNLLDYLQNKEYEK